MDNIIQVMHEGHTLKEALWVAGHICSMYNDFEERGGVITYNPAIDGYRFIPLKNINSGGALANVLFTADQEEFAKIVLPKIIKNAKPRYELYGSYHTHPQFVAYPSHEDLTVLFPGFTHNYIYSPVEEATREFIWVPEDKEFVLANTFWDND